MTCGIYIIKNVKDGKMYVGKSVNIEKRWVEHIRALKRGDHGNNYLQHVFNLFGIDIFKHATIKECEKEDLNKKELFYISKLNSKAPNGYNLTDGGEGLFNPSNEARQNMSIAHKRAIEKYGHPMTGRKHTSEAIEKIHSYRHTDEELEKMRVSSSGSNNSMFGKKQSLESNRKNSESQRREKSWRFGKKNKNATSKYFGVRRTTRGEQVYYICEVVFDGKTHYVGCSKSEIESAKKHDDYIIKNNLPHPLNFPDNN